MLRAIAVVRKAAVKPDLVVDTMSLTAGERVLSHAVAKGEGGLAFLVDLDKALLLNDGDALKLEDGRLVLVKAAAEPLLEVRAENPMRLLKAAWQLGGLHAPTEFTGDALYVQEDDELAEILRSLGCSVTETSKPFNPEQASGHCCHGHGEHDHHHHDHHHGHHHHEHDHDHHEHDHGGGCGGGGGCGCGGGGRHEH